MIACSASLIVLLWCSVPSATAQAPAPDLKYDTLFYTSGGLRVEAYLYKPAGPGPFPLVVYNHGSRAGNERRELPMMYVARILVPKGYAVLVPERRGYGKSEGASFSEDIGEDRGPKFMARLQAEADDVLAAVEHVIEEPWVDPTKVVVMGYSFGGITATLAASRSNRFAAAIIQAPGALNWDRVPELRTVLVEAARGIRAPAMCAVAENDRTTESTRKICEAISANRTHTELKVYPPFTPPGNGPTAAAGHALFGPQGVTVWAEDALDFIERNTKKGEAMPQTRTGTFDADLAFLQQHTNIIVLADPAGPAKVLVAPEYQGRVMTSTTGGADAPSFGWIGRAAVSSGKRQPHMNVFGGEDRFWLGPEGGQFALYFRKGDPFDLDHWQVPEAFDWGAWDVAKQSPASVQFRKRMALTNYSGASFDVEVERVVRVIGRTEAISALGTTPGSGVGMVAFESSNTVRNAGREPWSQTTGAVSIWILGQLNPSPDTTIVVPILAGPAATLGVPVKDDYFGKVPSDRLKVKDAVVFFRGDGQYRSKIGVPPRRALPVAGSYDAANHVLSIVTFTRPADARHYVNSTWEIQKEPLGGDVINSYNDGPPAPGKPPLGPFYELETSSPALALGPGQTYTHVHRTFHFIGPEAELDAIARATLKVSLSEIKDAFEQGSFFGHLRHGVPNGCLRVTQYHSFDPAEASGLRHRHCTLSH